METEHPIFTARSEDLVWYRNSPNGILDEMVTPDGLVHRITYQQGGFTIHHPDGTETVHRDGEGSKK